MNNMAKWIRYLRNKYILTLTIFSVYMLFLDDTDIFAIARQQIKLSKLKSEKEEVLQKYEKTKKTLDQLNSLDAIERFAREEKFFKKDDEDVFVIVYEGE